MVLVYLHYKSLCTLWRLEETPHLCVPHSPLNSILEITRKDRNQAPSSHPELSLLHMESLASWTIRISWQCLHSTHSLALPPSPHSGLQFQFSPFFGPLSSLKKVRALLAMPTGLAQHPLRENSSHSALGNPLTVVSVPIWLDVQELRGCPPSACSERSWPSRGSHRVVEDILALGQSTKVLLLGLLWARRRKTVLSSDFRVRACAWGWHRLQIQLQQQVWPVHPFALLYTSSGTCPHHIWRFGEPN